MGWRNVGKATEVIVGDGGFDAVEVMLRAITSDYEEKLSRKPTLQEVLMTLEMILKGSGHQYLNGLDESDLVEIKAKTRPRRKRQPFQTGDFFVVPLEKGKFGFGRVCNSRVEPSSAFITWPVPKWNLWPKFQKDLTSLSS